MLMAIISFAIVIACTHGFQFGCNFQNRNWQIVGSVYSCNEAEISLNNSLSLEYVVGNHLPGRTNNDVQALHAFRDATASRQLPKNIGKFFPNLSVLTWEVGQLTSITAEELESLVNLQVLNFYINNIVTLDGSLLQYTPKISWISFSFNLIINVGPNLLDNLDDLTFADFRNNECINSTAETPQEIQELIEKFSTQCLPLTTTTSTTTTTTTSTTTAPTTSTSTPSTTTTQTTTTEAACFVRCSVNEEIDEQSLINAEQGQAIEDLKGVIEGLLNAKDDMQTTLGYLYEAKAEQFQTNEELREIIIRSEKRIIELEKQMKEILAMP